MTKPRFSVAEYTTPKLTFAEDLALYRELGADGIGIDELKLDPHELVGKGRERFLHLWETRTADFAPSGERSAQ